MSWKDLTQPVCDRCGHLFGLFEHELGKWRCPRCLYAEVLRLRDRMKVIHRLTGEEV